MTCLESIGSDFEEFSVDPWNRWIRNNQLINRWWIWIVIGWLLSERFLWILPEWEIMKCQALLIVSNRRLVNGWNSMIGIELLSFSWGVLCWSWQFLRRWSGETCHRDFVVDVVSFSFDWRNWRGSVLFSIVWYVERLAQQQNRTNQWIESISCRVFPLVAVVIVESFYYYYYHYYLHFYFLFIFCCFSVI